ncbi:MAG: YgeY family selenium metabolism-linked hydrolase [Spirochaetia bacterium]|jgi:putative selenium metabolism hydrolase|nr:YgeY family selenium metabolism-linked hydrolase [Spirochaetia bacterium]
MTTLCDEDQQKLHSLCQSLVQIPSVTGTETKITHFLKQAMEQAGYDDVWIDEVGNVIGKINANQAGAASVLFDGHVDTVAVPKENGWTTDPFGGTIKDGKIWGRGISDMKGAVAAMVLAVAKVKQLGLPHGDLYVSGTIFEEIAEGYTLSFILQKLHPDYVVIGESTGLRLNIGQRGRAEIVMETQGKPAHSANPSIGINAVLLMLRLVAQVNQLPVPTHPLLGKGELVLTDIISSPYPGASVVPAACRVTYDRRLLPGETKESVLAPIQLLIEKLEKEDPKFKATARIEGFTDKTYTGFEVNPIRFAPAWVVNKDSTLVKKALEALATALGKEPELHSYSFCTNGSSSCGILKIPTIGFGPSEEYLAHTDDEHVELSSIDGAYLGYLQLATGLR